MLLLLSYLRDKLRQVDLLFRRTWLPSMLQALLRSAT
jgi:hypothetical protein